MAVQPQADERECNPLFYRRVNRYLRDVQLVADKAPFERVRLVIAVQRPEAGNAATVCLEKARHGD
jgi:hypothetical protein